MKYKTYLNETYRATKNHKLTNEQLRTNMVIGLFGETMEYAHSMELDELGDVTWYLVGLTEELGFSETVSDYVEKTALIRKENKELEKCVTWYSIRNFLRNLSVISEKVKKDVFQSRLDAVVSEKELKELWDSYFSMYEWEEGVHFTKVIKRNAEKLAKRYPQGFQEGLKKNSFTGDLE